MKPLHRHTALSIATASLLSTEFLLFLLVALSLPVIKPIYLLAVNAHVQPGQPVTSVAVKLRFGVWGLCAFSAYDGQESWQWNPDGLCFGPSVGYKIPQTILDITGYAQLANIVLHALTVLLILHPVVAALSLIGASTSLFLDSHAMHIISLIFTVFNSFLSSVVLAADLAITIVAKARVPGLAGGGLEVEWGNATWMVLVGVVLSWLGVILLSIPVCGCFGVRERYNSWEAKRHKGGSSDPFAMTER